MKKICVVTATRAEYGLLKNTIERIQDDDKLELCLVVTGMHLEERYGYTVQEIMEDQIPIAEKLPILSEESTELGITRTMGKASVAFGEMFYRQKPDMLLVLGDRYELFPVCQCALIFGIPIAHISGGEVTEGAIDDAVRNCITQMSSLHFPGCEAYRQRIISMGKEPQTVYNYGDVGVENIRKMDYMTLGELQESIEFSLDKPYACVTFHPVTKEKGTARQQVKELFTALERFPEMKFIITKANADAEGDIINGEIDRFVAEHDNCKAFFSLGIRRYLSALKYAAMVIGNSSSGIVEAPCFQIPTVNIGNRQKGRVQAESILNCAPVSGEIVRTMQKALSEEFQSIVSKAENPYGDGDTSEKIVETIKKYFGI
ncbi:MAG: UDP-N-acetylglucosamine 2-epimerase [Roseburia sp.]